MTYSLWYIYTIEYYSVINKKNLYVHKWKDILSFKKYIYKAMISVFEK